ncbi:hypothetical protein DFA_00488 [Cavenderia fasciculata]|uniref:Condensin complex subunit 1 C-terminal domain-containing protein n=1 Tax=Cavenderia fasciculata TaxID=261658 RepID=F4PS29_CACFS|nr:uncharacterized protein DFA_00488 [Cavenderia fasciculata]EGG20627.1 hypothetical protein DFA_00488 [Cavenderia fasciculata]|eukprot:XP_004358477.1 hypothetical protein DFA_00488 [Cavenderia fasciculata]
MEQPDDNFIEIVVTLAKEEEEEDQLKQKQKKKIDYNNNNNNKYKSASKQQFIEHTISKPEQVVSWLLYLIVKGTYPTIKEKAIQLLDRFLVKKGEELIESLSKEIVNAVKVETIKLLKRTLTDSYRQHLFGIIESFAVYLIPRGGWDELEPKMQRIVDGEEEEGEEEGARAEDEDEDDEDVPAKKEEDEEDEEDEKEELVEPQIVYNARGLLAMLLKPRILGQFGNGTHSEFIPDNLNNIFGFSDDNPKWMDTIAQQIIDTLFQVLNGNREERSTTYTYNMFRLLLVMAETNPKEFTPFHLESIISHLYKWLSEVKEMPMEEWTSGNSTSGSKLFNLNYFEERNNGIIPEYPNTHDQNYNQDDQLVEAVTTFDQFVYLLGRPLQVSMFNRFNLLLKSQHWKERYASLMSLSKFCDSNIMKQFPSILESMSNCFNDENIRVRWASIYCLIKLSVEYKEEMVESRDLFQVIAKSIRDPNERVQSSCCILIQTLMASLKKQKNKIVDNVLDELCNSFEILLQSPTLFLAENALIPLMSVIDTVKDRFRPYYPRFISILFTLLEKHHATIESRVLCSRVIKTISLCGREMGKMTFTKDIYKFMMFVKKNAWSFDLISDVFRASGDFINVIGKSFSIYLPMIIRMITNILDTPLSIQLEDDVSFQYAMRVLSALKGLNRILELSYDKVDNPLIPCAHHLVRPLCKLATFSNTGIGTGIQEYSLTNLPICVKLAYIHFGDRKDKKLEMFGMVINSVVFPSTLPSDTNVEELRNRINMADDLIDEMGSGAMTLDHAKTVMDLFYKVDKKLEFLTDQIRNENQDVIGEGHPSSMLDTLANVESRIYEMVGVLIKHNSDIVTPLITSDLLDKACEKLRYTVPVKEKDDDDEDDADDDDDDEDEENTFIIKRGILDLMEQYCEYGGESAINSFPQIIPPIVQCLTTKKADVRLKAAITLGAAAQLGKDRFAPWLNDVLHALNVMISGPDEYSIDFNDAREFAISSIGKIIRYVPQIASHASIIIPEWLGHLPIDDVQESNIIYENLCAIIRLYPNECFGNAYQHVMKLYNVINFYKEVEDDQEDDDENQELRSIRKFFRIQPKVIESLIEISSFIKETIESNWDNIPPKTKKELSKYLAEAAVQ